ncbi:mycothiol synthase [Rudaeicoccus suwonensis]|uniref:mycothiol synthase n=1 Tax=Rudaeicoccus suwonensis TaxID=657409 RepID=UPI001FEB44BB|nr:mycothiol synthase [Rudaeicoccus suwonensis]
MLTPTQFLAIADRAAAADGVDPLSETTRLSLRRDGASVVGAPRGEAGGAFVADDGSVELCVDPDMRRRGLGSAIAAEVLAQHPGSKFWAHANLPAAQALSRSLQLTVVRSLWRMGRPVDGEPAVTAPVLPDGFTARPFEVGRDEDAWLAVNSAAFVHHPEQGRMTRADLAERMAEPWFDPNGLLLIQDSSTGALAASHWTKVEAGQRDEGEVYVVAVAPAYQGRGLGRAVTALGLEHLKSVGVQEISLYVEGDNTAAVATYSRLGFTRTGIDVMYALPSGAH